MALRDYTDSPLFRQFIDRLMRENGLNPDQAASYLNMVLNASARNEDREGTFRMGASDFSRLKRGLSQSGRGLDADFLRRTRSAKELGELTEDEQIMLNLLNATNNPRFLGTMREGVNAVAGGERDAIQKAAMNYIQTFTLGNGDPRGGVGRIQRAMDGGSTAYGNDPLTYYNDTLLPRFNQITSDILKEGKFLASTEVTPQITRRKESVRNYDYGGLYPIAQDFSPNEFVEYNADDNVHYINVTSRPGTNDVSYKYAIPDYDIAYNNEYGNAERMFQPVENVVLYDRVEPFSQESVLLNDTLEFVPERIAELQQRGAIIPYSNARINQGNLNTSLDQIGRGWITPERSENFLNEYGFSRGQIARLRLQGLQEGWLKRTQSLGPNWQSYRGYNEQDDLALQEELEEQYEQNGEYRNVRDPKSPFKYVDPYEQQSDVKFENLPDDNPITPYEYHSDELDSGTGPFEVRFRPNQKTRKKTNLTPRIDAMINGTLRNDQLFATFGDVIADNPQIDKIMMTNRGIQQMVQNASEPVSDDTVEPPKPQVLRIPRNIPPHQNIQMLSNAAREGWDPMHSLTKQRLNRLAAIAEKHGIKVPLLTSYRDQDFQRTLYNKNVIERRKRGEKILKTARPGNSNHQAGMAVDSDVVRMGNAIYSNPTLRDYAIKNYSKQWGKNYAYLGVIEEWLSEAGLRRPWVVDDPSHFELVQDDEYMSRVKHDQYVADRGRWAGNIYELAELYDEETP